VGRRPNSLEAGMRTLTTRPIKAERNRRQRFNERARLEYLAGAEQDWRRRTGRLMSGEELERVLRRYPGDI
jgi:hypothetical protein